MALDREQVVDAAWHILQTYGLGDLSMRRLARELGVQPGALYWHVANKQELLTVLAERMVAPLESSTVRPAPGADAAALLTAHFRTLVLAVRDGADVVSVAHALDPLGMQPVPLLVTALTCRGRNPEDAEAVALTLTRFTLGSVTAQQTRESMGLPTATMAEEFEAGVRAILG